MSEGDTPDELQEYKAQLEQVEAALAQDPANEELLATRQALIEIVELSKTLDEQPADQPTSQQEAAVAAAAAGEETRFCAGQECEALHPSEKQWYNAVIKVLLDDGTLIVDFGGVEPPVQLQPAAVRRVGAGGAPAARYHPVRSRPVGAREHKASAPKQLLKAAVQAQAEAGDAVPTEVPAYLRIKPTDSEKVKQSKRKRAKVIKNKMRIARKEEEGAAKRAQWQAFAKKSGVAKHRSIFSTTTADAMTAAQKP